MEKCFLGVSYSDQAGLNAPKSCTWEKLAPQHSILVRIFFTFVNFLCFLGDLVIKQQTNTNVKNIYNSHYKWLEITINAKITENKVKSMSNTRT